MPDTTTTLTPDQLAAIQNLANYSYYLNPQIGNVNTNSYTNPQQSGLTLPEMLAGAGTLGWGSGMANFQNGDYLQGLGSILSMGFGDIIQSLFHKKKKPQWQPYTQDGLTYWQDPRTDNPVPVTGIPGADVQPQQEYQNMANQIRAISDLLPYYSQAVSGQAVPAAQAQLAAETATSGPRAALMTELYKTYGPQLNEIGNQIARQNAIASAQRDTDVLRGPGKELVQQALETAKLYDPEYFSTRALTGQRTNDLLNSINLSGGLSSTELDAITKGMARENAAQGREINTPSNFDTVANATQYGAAGRQRQIENQNQLSKAIQASTQFLPAAKSGVDVFQVATGRSSTPNTGDSRFTGISQANQDANSQASQLLNAQTSMWTTNQNNQLQRDLNQKDWADYLGQVTSSLGNIAGGVLGFI